MRDALLLLCWVLITVGVASAITPILGATVVVLWVIFFWLVAKALDAD